MKLIKNIKWMAPVLGVIMLTGCTDDLEIRNNIIPEGTLELNLAIPELEMVQTRATEDPEKNISELTVFIYGSDNSFIDKQSFATISSGNKVNLQLGSNAQNKNLKLYVVANANSNFVSLSDQSLSTVQNIQLETTSIDGKKLVMTGLKDVSSNTTSVDVELKRVAAKFIITVDNVNGYNVDGFVVKNVARTGFLGANEKTGDARFTAVNNIIDVPNSGTATEEYVYPSRGEISTNTDRAHLILSATKNGKANYYRVPIRTLKEGKTDEYENIDILPNHKYTIVVTDIARDGYPTIADAEKHPETTDAITYYIHDHGANVLSMVSDGTRELGLTYDFTWPSNVESSIITVKYYTTDKSEIPTVNTPGSAGVPELITGSDWLTMSYTTDAVGASNITGKDEESGLDDLDYSDGDKIEQDGVRKNYKLTAKQGIIGERKAVIRVEWMGLKRELTITRKMEGDLTQLLNTTLYIIEDCAVIPSSTNPSTYTYKIDKYWQFLASDEKGKDPVTVDDQSSNNPKITSATLFGVKAEANDPERPRNGGLHMAMPYGKLSDKWKYYYVISPNATQYGSNAKITNVETITGDNSFFSTEIKSGVLLVKPVLDDSFTYTKSTIKITIYSETNGTDYITLDVYHTGFFHYDGAATDKGFYYYEVAELANGKHWLDRNLRAKASGLYIEDVNGNNYFGTDEAYPVLSASKGEYVKIADPGDYRQEDNLDPTIITDICPPGYRVPTMSEWDRVRQSTRFFTGTAFDANHQYSTCYFSSTNGAGHIYFPKARYTNNGVSAGDGLSGYYWTQTPSQGLEKNQMGNYLKTLYINGGSNTYVNGYIPTQKMSLRCIEGNDDESVTESTNSISFKVKGATHVYLYTGTGANKSGLFTFPGQGITTYNGKDSETLFNYVSTYGASSLYVFFTVVDNSGKTWIIHKESDDFSHSDIIPTDGKDLNAQATLASEANLNEIEGWPVWIAARYFFNWSGTSLTSGNVSKESNQTVYNYRFYWEISAHTNTYAGIDNTTLVGWNDPASKYKSVKDTNWKYVEFSYSNQDGTFKFKVNGKYYDDNNRNNDSNIFISLGKFNDDDNDGVYCAYVTGTNTITGGVPTMKKVVNNKICPGDKINFYWKKGMKKNEAELMYLYLWDGYGWELDLDNNSNKINKGYVSGDYYRVDQFTYTGNNEITNMKFLFNDRNNWDNNNQTGNQYFSKINSQDIVTVTLNESTRTWTVYVNGYK